MNVEIASAQLILNDFKVLCCAINIILQYYCYCDYFLPQLSKNCLKTDALSPRVYDSRATWLQRSSKYDEG